MGHSSRNVYIWIRALSAKIVRAIGGRAGPVSVRPKKGLELNKWKKEFKASLKLPAFSSHGVAALTWSAGKKEADTRINRGKEELTVRPGHGQV